MIVEYGMRDDDGSGCCTDHGKQVASRPSVAEGLAAWQELRAARRSRKQRALQRRCQPAVPLVRKPRAPTGIQLRVPRFVPRDLLPLPENARQRAKAERDAIFARAEARLGPGVLPPAPDTDGWRVPDLPLLNQKGEPFGSLRRLFAALRELGLRPHPYGRERDDDVIQRLWCMLPVDDPRIEKAERTDFTSSYDNEADVAPDSSFGVNTLRLVMDPDTQQEYARIAEFGEWEQIVADVSRIGVGSLRHPQTADLRWNSLVPDSEIPLPVDIYDQLTKDDGDGDFSAIQRGFGALLMRCAVFGLQVVPTLFTYGGSKNFLEGLSSSIQDAIRAARPSSMDAPYASCAEGWSSLYVSQPEGLGYGFDSDDEKVFAQYILHVWWDPDMSEGLQMCARLKALALAAFSAAIGEYLATWDAGYRGGTFDFAALDSLVPCLELGNEMEAYFPASECGRIMALLAGPIKLALDSMQFRAASLASWVAEPWDDKLDWLKYSVVGLGLEVGLWTTRNNDEEQLDASALGGFWWPSSAGQAPSDPTSLLHQVGFHWYHHDQEIYETDGRLYSDVSTLKIMLGELHRAGYSLTWVVSEVGFHVRNNPNQNADGSLAQPYNPEASPEFQAGELVRRLLLLLHALGAERVSWHTFMSDIAPSSWSLFSTTGLRNDYGGAFSQSANAWRRPSWFAYRRLLWLLSHADKLDTVTTGSGLVQIVELRSDKGFPIPYDLEFQTLAVIKGPQRRYKRAYVAWMDQEAEASYRYRFTLWDEGQAGYRLLSMVPSDTKPTVASQDANGFATGETVDWEWNGWDWPQITTTVVKPRGGFSPGRSRPWNEIEVELQPLSTAGGRPGPICILTDAVSQTRFRASEMSTTTDTTTSSSTGTAWTGHLTVFSSDLSAPAMDSKQLMHT